MKTLEVVARESNVLGTITLKDNGEVDCSGDDIRAIFKSLQDRLGTPRETFAAISNSSNGYVAFRPR